MIVYDPYGELKKIVDEIKEMNTKAGEKK